VLLYDVRGEEELKEVITSGELIYAAVWAIAALILPWLVRGRWLALDLVAASAWAAALGAGTAAAAQAIAAPEPPGLVLATVVAGLIAVAIPHVRRIAVVEP
jgi:eukaryotic-like serine/threonine-protein kinase